MNLYSCRPSINAHEGFVITKFDADLNPLATYNVTNATCTCPAGKRPTCKHRSRLLPAFMKRNHIDDGWFLNDENMMWHRPLTEVYEDIDTTIANMRDGVERDNLIMETDEGPGQAPLAAMVITSPSTASPTAAVPSEGVGPTPFKRRI